MPDHLAEAVHHGVFGIHLIAEFGTKPGKRSLDTGWLVNGDLLANRQVHGHVQKRVDVAVLW
jgi:hypothetical protein